MPFRLIAGGLTTAALLIAPLNFGSTRPGGTWLLVAVLGFAGVCWALSLSLKRRVPSLSAPLLLGLAALLISLVWWLSHTEQATAPTQFTLSHFNRILIRWPFSVMNPTAGAALAWQAALGLAALIVADLARERNWLITFSTAIAATGVVVALLAVVQNQTLATGIFWRAEGRLPGKFWGTFFHHTAGGAYLNSVWPVALGLAVALRSQAESRRAWAWAFAAGLSTLFLLGAHTTHVSRFSSAAALIAVGYLALKLHRAKVIRLGPWVFVLPIAACTVAFTGGRGAEIAQRWQLFKFHAPAVTEPAPPEAEWSKLVRSDLLIPNRYNAGLFGDRGEAQQTAWRAIADRPWTGHGPANWRAAASQHSADPYVRTFYLYQQFAHEDFLQAWVERGIAGFIGVVLLLPGAVIFVLKDKRWTASAEGLIRGTAATALALLLAQALLDFPLQIPAIALNAAVLAGLCWSGHSALPTRLAPPAAFST